MDIVTEVPETLKEVKYLTVMHPAPNSGPRRGINLWAVLRPSFTPVRSFTVTGMSPRALFIPTIILPSLAAASSTEGVTKSTYTQAT